MSAPLPLRTDFSVDHLRRLARQARDTNQTQRLTALAVIYKEGSRGEADRIGGVSLQIVRGIGLSPSRDCQNNKITRPWEKRGTRPLAPKDQRAASTYIVGAICPKEGKAAGLILP